MIPVKALEALETGTIGKGEFITLCRLARYVPGKEPQPVEGTTLDMVDALGIPERTLQRHLVTLGSSGVVRCRQPQRGHWIVFGLCFDPEDADPPQMAPTKRQKWREPVVVIPSSTQGDSNLTAEQQQHLLDQCAHEAPKVADPEAVDRALREIGVKAAIAREHAQHYTLAQVEAVIADGRARADVTNLAGWVISALVEHWELPDSSRGRHKPRTSADYLDGPMGKKYVQR